MNGQAAATAVRACQAPELPVLHLGSMGPLHCNGSRFSPPREVFFVKLRPPSGEAIVIGLSFATRAAGLCPKLA